MVVCSDLELVIGHQDIYLDSLETGRVMGYTVCLELTLKDGLRGLCDEVDGLLVGMGHRQANPIAVVDSAECRWISEVPLECRGGYSPSKLPALQIVRLQCVCGGGRMHWGYPQANGHQ